LIIEADAKGRLDLESSLTPGEITPDWENAVVKTKGYYNYVYAPFEADYYYNVKEEVTLKTEEDVVYRTFPVYQMLLITQNYSSGEMYAQYVTLTPNRRYHIKHRVNVPENFLENNGDYTGLAFYYDVVTMELLTAEKYNDGEIESDISTATKSSEEFFEILYGYIEKYTYLRYESIATRSDGESDSTSGSGEEKDPGESNNNGGDNGDSNNGNNSNNGGDSNNGNNGDSNNGSGENSTGGNNSGGNNSGGNSTGGGGSGGSIIGSGGGVTLKYAKRYSPRAGVIRLPSLKHTTAPGYGENQCLPASMAFVDKNLGGGRNFDVFNNWYINKYGLYTDIGIPSQNVADFVGNFFSGPGGLPDNSIYSGIEADIYIMMDVATGDYYGEIPLTHTIVITGYDPFTGNLIYFDPYYGYEFEISYDIVKNSSFIFPITGFF